jgi:hypothetical protein
MLVKTFANPNSPYSPDSPKPDAPNPKTETGAEQRHRLLLPRLFNAKQPSNPESALQCPIYRQLATTAATFAALK